MKRWVEWAVEHALCEEGMKIYFAAEGLFGQPRAKVLYETKSAHVQAILALFTSSCAGGHFGNGVPQLGATTWGCRQVRMFRSMDSSTPECSLPILSRVLKYDGFQFTCFLKS